MMRMPIKMKSLTLVLLGHPHDSPSVERQCDIFVTEMVAGILLRCGKLPDLSADD